MERVAPGLHDYSSDILEQKTLRGNKKSVILGNFLNISFNLNSLLRHFKVSRGRVVAG